MTTPYIDPNLRPPQLGGSNIVSPQAGMRYEAVASIDPAGKSVNGCATLALLPSASYTLSFPAACTFSTQYITSVAYDATVTAFSGGASPTITFLFDRQGADGNWYPILPASGSGAASLATTSTVSIDIGLLAQNVTGGGVSAVYGSVHNVFTARARAYWAFGGTTAPTAVTFSMSITGR